MKITKNAIRCFKCDDVIVSEHIHDFKYCKCGWVAVDGGNDYLRRVWNSGPPEFSYEELSEYDSNTGH